MLDNVVVPTIPIPDHWYETGNDAVVILTVTTVFVHVIEFVTGLFITIGAPALPNT